MLLLWLVPWLVPWAGSDRRYLVCGERYAARPAAQRDTYSIQDGAELSLCQEARSLDRLLKGLLDLVHSCQLYPGVGVLPVLPPDIARGISSGVVFSYLPCTAECLVGYVSVGVWSGFRMDLGLAIPVSLESLLSSSVR